MLQVGIDGGEGVQNLIHVNDIMKWAVSQFYSCKKQTEGQ